VQCREVRLTVWKNNDRKKKKGKRGKGGRVDGLYKKSSIK
jgi:hypothetical protein